MGLDKSLNLDFQDFVSSVIHNTRKDITLDNKKDYTSIKSLTIKEVEDEDASLLKQLKTLRNFRGSPQLWTAALSLKNPKA